MAKQNDIHKERTASLRRQREKCLRKINHLEEAILTHVTDISLKLQLDEAHEELERIEQELEELGHPVEESRKPAPKARLPLWVIAAALAVLAVILGVVVYIRANRGPGEPLATIVGFRPVVEFRTAGQTNLKPACFGTHLYRGDAVYAYEDAGATICCQNGLLFKLPEQSNLTVECQDTADDRIIGRLDSTTGSRLVSVDSAPSNLASLDQVRGSQSISLTALSVEPVSLLLSPRQLTHESRPTFRWTAAKGADAYRLSLEGKTVNWSVTLKPEELTVSQAAPFIMPAATVLEAAYPPDAPPLEPNTTYVVKLQPHLPGVRAFQEAAESTFLELIGNDAAAALDMGISQIQALAVPEGEKAYLLSLLYQEHELWAAAAEQTEKVARLNPESPPLLQLGNLYLRAGLVSLAEANYRRALETARAGDDLYTQAAALTGLGQVAYAARADAATVEYFEQALALYRRLGEEGQADEVKNLLAEVRPGG